MKVLVTGGCGFIGSNFIRHLLLNGLADSVANLDKQTYAAQGQNIKHMGLELDRRYSFFQADIAKKKRFSSNF